MNIIVRFYWQHDLDLVGLAMHPNFDMSYWLTLAVMAEARGADKFRIPLPPSIPYSIDLESCYVHIYLAPGKDDDVIAFLNGIRSGFRNSAIKGIFRKYLETPFFDVYLNEEAYRTKSRVHTRAGQSGKSRLQRKKTKPVKSLNASTPPARPQSIKAAGSPKPISATGMPKEKIPKDTMIKDSSPGNDKVIDLSAEPQPEDGDSFDLFGAIEDMISP